MDYVQRKIDMMKLRIEYGMTLQQIGDVYGITRERVRQVLGKGTTEKAREASDNRLLDKILQNLDKDNEELMETFGIGYATLLRLKKEYMIRNAVKDDKESYGYIGSLGEEIICQKIRDIGLPAKRMQFSSPYDIAVGAVRVDAKYATKTWEAPSLKHTSPLYRFSCKRGKKYRDKTDFFIFLINDGNEDYFIIPSRDIPTSYSSVAFTWPCHKKQKLVKRKNWREYHNRWDLLFRMYLELGGELNGE